MYYDIIKLSGASRKARFEALKSAISSKLHVFTKPFAKFKQLMSKEIKNPVLKATEYAGLDLEAAYAAAAIDSKVGKFLLPNPQSLVFQVPLKKGEAKTLDERIKVKDQYTQLEGGMPVVLWTSAQGYVDKRPLYLASPCHADITTQRGDVVCGSYQYSIEGDKAEIKCSGISNVEGKEPGCGFTYNGKGNPSIYQKIRDILRSRERQLYEVDANEITVNLPLFGDKLKFTTDNLALANLFKEDGSTESGLKMECEKIKDARLSSSYPGCTGNIISIELKEKYSYDYLK